jgi:hypothetical protein
VWRLPLQDGAAWLKCVPPFFAHEGAMLHRLAGGPVPPLLAAEPGRVLMADIPGEDQYGADLPVLHALVALLVGLQVREIGQEDQLLALGLPDWRGPALSVAVEDVVRRHAPALDAVVRQRLTRLLDGLDRRWADLAACGLPDTLVHGDVHPGNARGPPTARPHGLGRLRRRPPAARPAGDARPARRPDGGPASRTVGTAPGDRPCPDRTRPRAAALLAPLAAARQAVVTSTSSTTSSRRSARTTDDPPLWLGTPLPGHGEHGLRRPGLPSGGAR